MTMMASFRVGCNGSPRELCPEEGPWRTTEKDAFAAASQAGWKVSWGYSLGGDYCPKHIPMMDRVDWGSTA